MARVRAFERARAQKLECLLLKIGGAQEQSVIAPARPTDATEQMIRLVAERLEQGPGIGVDQGEQRTQRAPGGAVMLERKRVDGFFAAHPTTRETARESIDRVAMPHDGVRIPLAQRVLLGFEQTE